MDYSQELRQLEAEGEIPIMDLIASLPTEITAPPPLPEQEKEAREKGEEEGEKEKGEEVKGEEVKGEEVKEEEVKGEEEGGEKEREKEERESAVMELEDTQITKRKTRSVSASSITNPAGPSIVNMTPTVLTGLRLCLLRGRMPSDLPPPRSPPRRAVEGRV